MKNLKRLVVVLSVLIAIPASAATHSDLLKMTAGDAVSMMNNTSQSKPSRIDGIVPGYLAGAIIMGNGTFYCLPPHLEITDHVIPIMSYVSRNPDQLGKPYFAVIKAVLSSHYPCKK